MTEVRIWIVGMGTVGRWVADALDQQADELLARYGVTFRVVGSATGSGGFMGDEERETALEGLRVTEADVLVETAGSPEDGEPGAMHMFEALRRGIPVVTSNKWPVALHGVELAETARANGVQFRAESTVMSGTPVLGAITEGLAGARPSAIRGVVNATTNAILTTMGRGVTYARALDQAQAAGLAEPDPSADVNGRDSLAKAMILSALVFGNQLDPGEVAVRGISELDEAEVRSASAEGKVTREVTSVLIDGDRIRASVEPLALESHDPLARISGAMNCLAVQAEPLGEIQIAGPGAGPKLAGQGVLSDLIRVATSHR